MKIQSLLIFFVLLLLVVAGAALAASGKKDLASEVETLKTQVAALQTQAQSAQDYIAIANLQAAYGYYVDKCMWDQTADLFAKDGTLEIGLRGHEQVWAIFGAITALLKLAGLASRLSPRWQEYSDGLLASGLFMSIVFWMIVGISRVVDFPHSITPVALTGLGVAAAFQLAQKRDPRETWR